MKIVKRILLAIAGLVVVAVISLFVYLQSIKPQLSGEEKIKGLSSDVEILYDEYGIPHIYAQNEADAFTALGYVHAQDRLFQMEMLKRAASGRLSEVLGPELLEVDKLFRTIGINEFAKQNGARFLSSDTTAYVRAIHAYIAGVNQFIENGPTPLEFTIIGIPKTEFKPEDVYLAIGFMTLGFAEGFQADPVFQKIKTELGEEYLSDLAVNTPGDAVRIQNFRGPVKAGKQDKLIAGIRRALDKLPVPLMQGSNGWVVSSEKSVSGFPILANDTHIGFSQPAVWYEAHLEYPGMSFYGHHLAGFPFGVLGNNRFCGWGLTMFENDDVDFFTETANPDNPNQVKFKDAWEELKTRTEIIKVKNQEDVVFEVKRSRHGPIVNGIVENVAGDVPVALSWMLLQQENRSLEASYKLLHAASFEDAQKSVAMVTSPGLNYMYADVAGNIAWWAAAQIPVRPPHVQSKVFLDGASGNDEYLGFYDFSKNPHTINPPWGFVYSANNQPDSVEGVLYPGYYYPKGRAGRIFDLLSVEKKFSVDDIKSISLDMVSSMHVEIARSMTANFDQVSDSEIAFVVNTLNAWDGSHVTGSVAPAVYYNLLSQVLFLTMQDEIGADAIKSLLTTAVLKNSVNGLLKNEASPWWDDLKTKDVKETRRDIVFKAAQRTVAILKETCGENPESWTWGRIHTLTHNHPLGKVKPLDKLFSIGPFAVEGGSEVINNLDFGYDTTGYFPVRSGPALRKITDFADLENGVTASPTGQSGNVMSPHYSDQAEMFATGRFRKMLMNRQSIESTSTNKLILRAAQ